MPGCCAAFGCTARNWLTKKEKRDRDAQPNLTTDTSVSTAGTSDSATAELSLERKRSFHSFPLQNKALLKQWLHNMRRANFIPTKLSKLCSDHFSPECFVGHDASVEQVS